MAEMVTRICQFCGKNFEIPRYRLNEGRGKFCSRECGHHHKTRPMNKIKRICSTCGAEFYCFPCEMRKYCSNKCYHDNSENKLKVSILMSEKYSNGKHPSIGKERSPETRTKISGKLKGNRNSANWSDERREAFRSKISGEKNPMYGKIFSPEYRKKISDGHKGIQAGDKHPNWQGGKSFEPYCPEFTDGLKEEIREKFGRKCFLCPNTENGKKLSVHHIDYNKNDICNGKAWPLIPLCNSCHMKTNFNRWYWFNLLISYWITNSEISLQRFPFSTI